jgi:hypothetical protein
LAGSVGEYYLADEELEGIATSSSFGG